MSNHCPSKDDWEEGPWDGPEGLSHPPGVPSFGTGNTMTTRQLLESHYSPNKVHQLSILAYGTAYLPTPAKRLRPPTPPEDRGFMAPPPTPPPLPKQQPSPAVAVATDPPQLDDFEKAEMAKVISKRILGSRLHQAILEKLQCSNGGLTPARIAWAFPDLAMEVDRYCRLYQIPPCISSMDVLKEMAGVIFEYGVDGAIRFYRADESKPPPNQAGTTESLACAGDDHSEAAKSAVSSKPSVGASHDMDISMEESPAKSAPLPAQVQVPAQDDDHSVISIGSSPDRSAKAKENEPGEEHSVLSIHSAQGPSPAKKITQDPQPVHVAPENAAMELLRLLVQRAKTGMPWPRGRIEIVAIVWEIWLKRDGISCELQSWLQEHFEGYPSSHQRQRAKHVIGRLLQALKIMKCLLKSPIRAELVGGKQQSQELQWDIDRINAVLEGSSGTKGAAGKADLLDVTISSMRKRKIYGEILYFLAQNPDGSTVTDILNNVKRFSKFIHGKSKLYQVEFTPTWPTAILSRCAGIIALEETGKETLFVLNKEYDGKKSTLKDHSNAKQGPCGESFIADDTADDRDDDVEIVEHSNKVAFQKQIAKRAATSDTKVLKTGIDDDAKCDCRDLAQLLGGIGKTPDGVAAMDYLVMLRAKYNGQTWPTSEDVLRSSMDCPIPAASKPNVDIPFSLRKLFENQQEKKVPAETWERFLRHYESARCLEAAGKDSCSFSHVGWDMDRVNAVTDFLLLHPLWSEISSVKAAGDEPVRSKAKKQEEPNAQGGVASECDIIEIQDSDDEMCVLANMGKNEETNARGAAMSTSLSPKGGAPLGTGRVSVSLVTNAAVETLIILRAAFRLKMWPNKPKSLQNYLRTRCKPHKLAALGALGQLYTELVLMPGNPMGRLLNHIGPELLRLGCCWNAEAFKWNYGRVNALLIAHGQHRVEPSTKTEPKSQKCTWTATNSSTNSRSKLPNVQEPFNEVPSVQAREPCTSPSLKRSKESTATTRSKRRKTGDKSSQASSSAIATQSLNWPGAVRALQDETERDSKTAPPAVRDPVVSIPPQQESSLRESFNEAKFAPDYRSSLAARRCRGAQLGFDVSRGYAIVSVEDPHVHESNGIIMPSAPVVHNDMQVLLNLLPRDLAVHLSPEPIQRELTKIVLDKGRQPVAWAGCSRVNLAAKSRPITNKDISDVLRKLGSFAGDNRACLDGQLHRVSAVRNRQQVIVGLTIQVGRHVDSISCMISDLLFADPKKSVLLVGEPGSGKTTLLREVACRLAEKSNVAIVDTNNEIGGDGDIPHPSIGESRRIMVLSLEEQANVILQCADNHMSSDHTNNVMVIDKIGLRAEVEALRTCKDKRIRLIASTQGSFRRLVQNPQLRGLICSGVQGDCARTSYSPVFDIIVELQSPHKWRIITMIADATNCILCGQQYAVQSRTRDPVSGSFQVAFEMAC